MLDIIFPYRLCGRRPFESNNALKLEELIQKGELTFSEIEWINVSQTGKALITSMHDKAW